MPLAIAPDRSSRRCIGTTSYPVPDEDSQVVAIHVRRDFDDGTRGLGGRKPVDLPLYGLADLCTEAAVVVVEGEKARDALARIGIPALATVTGAGSTPSQDAPRPLRARETVWLWPDNDSAGRSHMRRIARCLIDESGHSPEAVRVIVWSDAPPKGDAADFVVAGGTEEDVRRLSDDAIGVAEFLSNGSKEGVSSEGMVTFTTARRIGQMTGAEPSRLVGPLVYAGGITELVDRPKASGKTTLALRVFEAVLQAAPFLGYPTQRTPVVYLTEQPPTSFRHALGQARLLDRDDFHALFWHDTIGIPWLEIVAAARTHSVKVGARLLIIDTLGQFTGLRGDAENNAGKAIAATPPLQEAAGWLWVLVLRHERKWGGEVGDFGRGSSAFAGAVDVILSGHVPLRRHRGMKNDPAYVRGCRRVFHSSLRRAEGASRSTIRHLHVLSRFDEAPDLLVIELTPDGYVALGTETAVAEAEARERILTTAPTSEADALTETELLAACGVKRTIGRESIGDHLAADRLRRRGAGKRGDPFRYWQPQLPAVLMVTDGTTGNPSESNDADFTTRRRA